MADVFTRRVTVADGVDLAVWEWPGSPDGVPFLLVHGLASNAQLWSGVAERLHRQGHPVAAVDLRGHGRSAKPEAGYDFPTMVDDLCRVVDALGYDRPVGVGQSLGGNLMIELAARRPDRVRGVACVDGGWIELADRFPQWEECAAALAPPPMEGRPRDELERHHREHHPDWPEEGIQAALANFEVRADGTVAPRLSRERHMRILRELWGNPPSRRFAGLEVPVLLLPARRESGWEGAVKTAEATIPQVRCRWVEGDHDLHAHRPGEVVRELQACVEEGFFR